MQYSSYRLGSQFVARSRFGLLKLSVTKSDWFTPILNWCQVREGDSCPESDMTGLRPHAQKSVRKTISATVVNCAR